MPSMVTPTDAPEMRMLPVYLPPLTWSFSNVTDAATGVIEFNVEMISVFRSAMSNRKNCNGFGPTVSLWAS